LIPMYDVLCLTPQILVNNLNRDSVPSLSRFSLMVLDECHHARGSDPYAQLMRKYLIEKIEKNVRGLPQVRILFQSLYIFASIILLVFNLYATLIMT